MKFKYPQSVSCRFDGFPHRIEIRCGRNISELSKLFSFGSKLTLTQTTNSGQEMGWMPDQNDSNSYYDAWVSYDQSTGENTYIKCYTGISDIRMIYTDTGSDSEYTLKVSFIGYGSFFTKTASDQYYLFDVYKSIVIENSNGNSVEFGDDFICETKVPVSVSLASMFNVKAPTYSYSDVVIGSISSTGTIYIDGVEYVIHNGQTISINSVASTVSSISYINGCLIIY